jgi:hypothetical protein
MNLLTQNSPYYHLLKYLLFLLKHPVYIRMKGNIKMDIQEVGYGGMDWIELAQDRDRWRTLENAVIDLLVP